MLKRLRTTDLEHVRQKYTWRHHLVVLTFDNEPHKGFVTSLGTGSGWNGCKWMHRIHHFDKPWKISFTLAKNVDSSSLRHIWTRCLGNYLLICLVFSRRIQGFLNFGWYHGNNFKNSIGTYVNVTLMTSSIFYTPPSTTLCIKAFLHKIIFIF